jgi:hypothetical protein
MSATDCPHDPTDEHLLADLTEALAPLASRLADLGVDPSLAENINVLSPRDIHEAPS